MAGTGRLCARAACVELLRRDSQGAAVPLRDRQDGAALREANTARGRLEHSAPPCCRRGNCDRDRVPHFPATGITDYLTNGGRIEVAQRMAGTRTPKLRAFTTGATATSAWARSSGSEFKAWLLGVLYAVSQKGVAQSAFSNVLSVECDPVKDSEPRRLSLIPTG